MNLRCLSSSFLLSIVIEVLDRETRQEKPVETSGISVGKELVKLSLFTDYVILYVRNSRDLTRKRLELIYDFSKRAAPMSKYKYQLPSYMSVVNMPSNAPGEQSHAQQLQKNKYNQRNESLLKVWKHWRIQRGP